MLPLSGVKVRIVIVVGVVLLLYLANTERLYSQDGGLMSIDTPFESDTNVYDITIKDIEHEESQKTDQFYDSLKSKSERRALTKLIHGSIFRPKRDTTARGRIVDAEVLYERYRGKEIKSITIDRKRIYGEPTKGFKKMANSTHSLTKESVIKFDLLFKQGDKVDPNQMVRNQHLLRSRGYIADVDIALALDSEDTTMVNVYLITRDRWSIALDGSYRKEGRTAIEIFDENFLGTGTTLSLETSVNRKNWNYGGNMLNLHVPNILGSFFKGNIKIGRSFEDIIYRLHIQRDFIKQADYMAGLLVGDQRQEVYQVDLDTTTIIKSRYYDVWAGKSLHINSINSNIYLTARYEHQNFIRRPPETGARYNPIFHGYNMALFGLGLYREKFYNANMIYGYGTKEYLTAGYRAELICGHSWGEYDNDMYIGINLRMGGVTSIGHLSGETKVGGYIDSKRGTWWRSTAHADIRWVSNLYRYRRSSMRQFISLNYTRGWHRAGGSNETLEFTDKIGPQTITEYMTGRNRAVLSTETVIFTPYQPLGFRLAIFGFADFALLGDSPYIFQNAFATTFGIGIRFKNERMVFRTIQLKIGVALGKGGFLKNRYIRFSNEQGINSDRYIPEKPQVVELK